VAHEGFLKDKCVPRAKKLEHHCFKGTKLFDPTKCTLAITELLPTQGTHFWGICP